jgi:hypothetical protein
MNATCAGHAVVSSDFLGMIAFVILFMFSLSIFLMYQISMSDRQNAMSALHVLNLCMKMMALHAVKGNPGDKSAEHVDGEVIDELSSDSDD